LHVTPFADLASLRLGEPHWTRRIAATYSPHIEPGFTSWMSADESPLDLPRSAGRDASIVALA